MGQPSTGKLAANVGEIARQARLRAGLTQADVAERVGLATEVYGRLERGRMLPSVPSLRRLCIALRMPSDTFLGLNTGEVPTWAAESAPPEEFDESPELRRLMRTLRKLEGSQLKLIGLVAAALQKR
ncbi:helix-turn-helix transcriptional regulator [Archangium violaceum]|uniref:helix-turn-helix domain-containing protein n=1 Tax=Archangium TaxID=47 RepID=UPI0019522C29|nr:MULTISPECIES: helix-turn-helix transcriptional regulator [Archangium]QRN98291.1 helix-turn-helix transcriptional regulator [Archangium violaceum]